MGCWVDFGPFVEKFIPDVSAEELKAATLMASVALGEDLRGFEDVYRLHIGETSHRREDHWGDGYIGFSSMPRCTPLHIALPVTSGWRLNSVNSVKLNDEVIARVNVMYGSRCSVFEQVCDGVSINPAPRVGGELEIIYSVDIVPGEVGNDMPDFLYTKYSDAMTKKIIQLVYEMRQLFKFATIYERQYVLAMHKARARRATGTAKIAGATARWM